LRRFVACCGNEMEHIAFLLEVEVIAILPPKA
jgi:hypothetical protein